MHLRFLLGSFLLVLLPVVSGLAQPESESPYSDQAFDPVANPEWYESPFLWLGVIVFLLVLFYFLRRNKRRSRTFMGDRE